MKPQIQADLGLDDWQSALPAMAMTAVGCRMHGQAKPGISAVWSEVFTVASLLFGILADRECVDRRREDGEDVLRAGMPGTHAQLEAATGLRHCLLVLCHSSWRLRRGESGQAKSDDVRCKCIAPARGPYAACALPSLCRRGGGWIPKPEKRSQRRNSGAGVWAPAKASFATVASPMIADFYPGSRTRCQKSC